MPNKKVLLIAYYWPPSGGAGVHRWLRFSKYFKENNCDLTVYCPEDAAWPVVDDNLSHEVSEDLTVIRRKIFEPHKYLGSKGNVGTGFTETKKAGLLKRLVVWVRGNLFIPDSRKYWIRPSTRYLSKYLKAHPEITTVISSGPPHSMHLIARKLKKKFDIHWIADFRDPWTQIDFYENLNIGKRADRRHHQLEAAVLNEADEVITVSSSCADGLAEVANKEIRVITNGYEFPDFDTSEIQLDDPFTISHFGSMPFARNPLVLWKAIANILPKNEAFRKALKIRLIGTVDFKVIESLKSFDLESYVEFVDAVPHNKSIELQRQTQLLLLVANNTGNVKGILTGKFFEYLGAKRPIVAIGMGDSDLEKAVQNTNCGAFVPFQAVEKMEHYLLESFDAYKAGSLNSNATNLDQYHSRTLAKQVIELIH